jgi:hypothetical protein
LIFRTLFAFSGIWTFLVDAYPLYAASALAANVFVRCMFAGAFPLFGEQSEFLPSPPWVVVLQKDGANKKILTRVQCTKSLDINGLRRYWLFWH